MRSKLNAVVDFIADAGGLVILPAFFVVGILAFVVIR